jgi:hypothetical protein
MRKLLIAIISGVVGLVLGALIVLFLLGSPKAKPLPGSPVRAPDPQGDPPGTVIVTLDEKFFDPLLATIFRDIGAPSFPLELTMMERNAADGSKPALLPAAMQNDCPDLVVLESEGSNTKTSVHFVDGKILAPLAFNGSKNILGGCVRFKGWAQASINLSFDQEKQTVYGQINVEGVNLEGAPAAVGGIATMLVQRSINQRINPLEILRAPQLALAMPVVSSNGTLKAQVKDVRSEVKDNKLVLHITYDFTGVRGGQPQT